MDPALQTGDQNIRDRLLAHGFTEELYGESRPPAVHYFLGGEQSGFYAEFVSPLQGNALDRKQRPKLTLEIAGIVTQQLRYIELLLHEPWTVHLNSDHFTGAVRIANPVTYLAQKVLIHGVRDREDRAKDILYMHDTFELFGAQLPNLAELWLKVVSPQLHPRASRTVSQTSKNLFGFLTDDIRRAAEISTHRALSPEAILAVCRYGYIQIIG